VMGPESPTSTTRGKRRRATGNHRAPRGNGDEPRRALRGGRGGRLQRTRPPSASLVASTTRWGASMAGGERLAPLVWHRFHRRFFSFFLSERFFNPKFLFQRFSTFFVFFSVQ
jgi:hypothetical protein